MNTFLEATTGVVGEMFSSFFAFARNAFINFGFNDAVDIIILTFFFFLALRFFRGRKAGALIIGIIVCLLILFFASLFDLRGTYYIFSGVTQIGALALVIIFQPEIRDVLEKLGTGSLTGIHFFGDQKKKNQLYYSVIDNICAAVSDLSASKTGALMVIVRTTKLDDVIQTGIKIDSNVNSFLIRNIFFNRAPLHDGAVIIDDARIAAAGCLLPLTRRSDIDSDLGTRHRAAIGMSETSDAITIVVSEETGSVSVAYDCTLTRNYTPETLRRFLMSKMLKNYQEGDEE